MKLNGSIPSSEQARSSAPVTLQFTLEQAPMSGQSFEATLDICPSPTCGCANVGFACRPFPVSTGSSSPPLEFRLDVIDRSASAPGVWPSKAKALGRAFAAELAAADWHNLLAFFIATKRRQMETMDLDALDAHLPLEVLAGEGTTMGYAEMFPWAVALEFVYEDAPCYVDDQYCVRPGCTCTDAGLTFFRSSHPEHPWPDASRSFVLVRYDYETVQWKVEGGRIGASAADDLIRAINRAHPDLRDTLRRRHGQLKQLAARLMPEPARDSQAADDPESASPSRLSPAPQPVRAEHRPGRNEPCPCGSGKKFKKCCGRS